MTLSQDPERVLATLAARRPSLELGTLDLCFLVALHVRGQAAQLASFPETTLEDTFAQVCTLVEPGSDPRRRAGAAIQRLRDQRLLARVDGQGVVRTGEFALSRLASGIVEFFLEDDVLTRESLTLLTGTLRATLETIRTAATAASTPEEWAARVTGPLRVTIAELVAGIERRQRGLDLQQEDFQAEIRRLLEADWFGAIDRCQGLLESTAATLRELNEVLLRDTSVLLAVLHDIQDLAIAGAAMDAEQASMRLMDQIDRIAAWGAARQRAWSEYFQYVHRYLRDVVRLDPSRALTQRLREQLAGGAAWTLTIAGATPIRLLRTVTPVRDKPPVARPRAPREKDPAAETGPDPQEVLESEVKAALDEGAHALSEVTTRVAATMEPDERFGVAGRVAATVAKLTRPQPARERPWVPVSGDLVIEEWPLERRSGS